MYSNLENAYNDNSKDLDKMAKALNKKKINYFNHNNMNLIELKKNGKMIYHRIIIILILIIKIVKI